MAAPSHAWLAGEAAPVLPEAGSIAPRDAAALAAFFAAFPDLQDVSLAQELGRALALPRPPEVIQPRAGEDAEAPCVFKRPQAVVALADATLLVADRDAGTIQRLSLDGEVVGSFGADTGLVAPMSIAMRRDGSVVVADFTESALCIYAPATGALVSRLQDPALIMPKGCVELATGEMLVCSYGTRRLLLWGRDDSLSHVVLPGDGHERMVPGPLAVAADGLTVFLHDELAHTVVAVRFQVGDSGLAEPVDVRPIMSGVHSEGIEALPNGSMLVSDTSKRVVHHVAADGQPIGVYGAGPGTDPGEFDYPTGLCAIPGNRVVVCDKRNQRLQVLEYAGRDRAAGAIA